MPTRPRAPQAAWRLALFGVRHRIQEEYSRHVCRMLKSSFERQGLPSYKLRVASRKSQVASSQVHKFTSSQVTFERQGFPRADGGCGASCLFLHHAATDVYVRFRSRFNND